MFRRLPNVLTFWKRIVKIICAGILFSKYLNIIAFVQLLSLEREAQKVLLSQYTK